MMSLIRRGTQLWYVSNISSFLMVNSEAQYRGKKTKVRKERYIVQHVEMRPKQK